MWSPPEGTFFGGIPASNKDSMDDGREGGGGGANAPHAAPGDELRTDEAYMTTDDGHNVDTRLEEDRKLWLWVHAAAVEETLQEMKNACALDSTSWCGSLEVRARAVTEGLVGRVGQRRLCLAATPYQ